MQGKEEEENSKDGAKLTVGVEAAKELPQPLDLLRAQVLGRRHNGHLQVMEWWGPTWCVQLWGTGCAAQFAPQGSGVDSCFKLPASS